MHRALMQYIISVLFVGTDIGMMAMIVPLRMYHEPFSQADASINRRFGGTGLGTTIARQLTEAMGGRLEVFSEPVQGTRFTVFIPLRTGHKKQQGSPHYPPSYTPNVY